MFPSTSAPSPITIDVLATPRCTPRPVILQHDDGYYGEAIQLLPCNAEYGKLETSSPVKQIVERIVKRLQDNTVDNTVTLSDDEVLHVYLQGWKWAEEVHDRTLQAMRQHLPDQPYPHGDPRSQLVLLDRCRTHPTSSLAKDFRCRVGSNESKEWIKNVLYIAHMNDRHKPLATCFEIQPKGTTGQKDDKKERRED